MICLFARFFEVLEAWVIGCVLDSYGSYLFGDQTGETFTESEAQRADAAWMEAEGRGQDEVRAIGFEQIGRADVGLEACRNEGDDVHEGVGGLATLFGEIGDLFQGQDVTGVKFFVERSHWRGLTFRSASETVQTVVPACRNRMQSISGPQKVLL